MGRVLIGYSRCQLTAKAFRDQGHEVFTCDILPVDSPFHLQMDVWEALEMPWDFAVLHPMCTYLTVSAAWAYTDGPYHMKTGEEVLKGQARRDARELALLNFKKLTELKFPVAIENPARSFISTRYWPATQIVQPYMFGDNASKATGFWLTRGVPHLKPTNYIPPKFYRNGRKLIRRWANQAPSGAPKQAPGKDRWLARSKTWPGMADAMGSQWGLWLKEKLANS